MVALWATATIAAGATYLIVRATESGEGHFRGQDYTERGRCTNAPQRAALVGISGFTPMSGGETAMVSPGARLRVPALIYVWRGERGCVAEWGIDDRH